MSMLEISYRPNPSYSIKNQVQPSYYASFSLEYFGLPGKVTSLPLYAQMMDGGIRSNTYTTYVAGLPIQGSLQHLPERLDAYLQALIRFSKLPEFLFVAQGNGWPVYHLTRQFITRSMDGVVFTTLSIAELYQWLVGYVSKTGRVHSAEETKMLYLSHTDLQLHAVSIV